MTEKIKKKRTPKRARFGMSNGSFRHGGYVVDLLTEEERKQYHEDMARYKKDTALSGDLIMRDLLHHYELAKIRLQRLECYLFDPVVSDADKLSAMRLANDLTRIMSLLATRMGRTYVSRQRRKEKIVRKTPIELLEEGEE